MKAKSLASAILAAAFALAITTSCASATTLEVGGVAKNASVSVEGSLRSPVVFEDTFGNGANGCTVSSLKFATSTLTGATVGGPVTTMGFSGCTNGPPTVDALGSLTIERIGSTTNGTVRSTGLKLTVPSPFGTLTCTTSGTDIGTVTGVASGKAPMDLSGVLPCTIIGTMKFQWPFVTTSPSGLGVTG
jgi:hypothetical protein